MNANFNFTFADIEAQYSAALDLGYTFITCAEYVRLNGKVPPLTVINRVDIDLSVKKADRLREIFDSLDIAATFFVRLHAPEYNPFSFENYRVLKNICADGHEIGYHSEIIDQAAIWDEEPCTCLKRDIDVLNRMLDISIKGIASHSGMTGLNNLDFWKDKSAADYGMLYEAYTKTGSCDLFSDSFYVSDSEWTQWKCYDKGSLVKDDRRSFGEHARDKRDLIYLLIHSDTYYDKHIYE